MNNQVARKRTFQCRCGAKARPVLYDEQAREFALAWDRLHPPGLEGHGRATDRDLAIARSRGMRED